MMKVWVLLKKIIAIEQIKQASGKLEWRWYGKTKAQSSTHGSLHLNNLLSRVRVGGDVHTLVNLYRSYLFILGCQ